MGFDMPRDEPEDREEYEKWEAAQMLHEPIGEFWLCAGPCGDWKKGMAAAPNGSGYVCAECEQDRLSQESAPAESDER